MADILEEVLRDHSDEKKIYYFKKILPIVISFSLIVVALLCYNKWHQDRKLSYQMQVSDKFFEILLRNPEIDKNAYKNLDNVAVERNSNVSALALLKQIGIQLKEHNEKEAKILLEKIILNNNYDEITRAYAYMSWLGITTNLPHITPEDRNMFEQGFVVFADEEYPFKGTINLLRAFWYIKDNQKDKAVKILQKVIISENVSLSNKEQARALLSTIQ